VVHLGTGCFCMALDFFFTSESFLEIPPGTAVVFSPATLVMCQGGMVNVGKLIDCKARGFKS